MDRFFVIQFLFFVVWTAALLYYPPLSGGALVPVPSPASGAPRPALPPHPPTSPAVRPPGAPPSGALAQPVPSASATPSPSPAAAGKYGADGEWSEDAAQAQALAASMNRPLAILFTGTDWCNVCQAFEAEALSKPAFKEFCARKLVLLRCEFPRHSEQPAARKAVNARFYKFYGAHGFPTIVVTDPAGRPLGSTDYLPGGEHALIAKLETFLPH